MKKALNCSIRSWCEEKTQSIAAVVKIFLGYFYLFIFLIVKLPMCETAVNKVITRKGSQERSFLAMTITGSRKSKLNILQKSALLWNRATGNWKCLMRAPWV